MAERVNKMKETPRPPLEKSLQSIHICRVCYLLRKLLTKETTNKEKKRSKKTHPKWSNVSVLSTERDRDWTRVNTVCWWSILGDYRATIRWFLNSSRHRRRPRRRPRRRFHLLWHLHHNSGMKFNRLFNFLLGFNWVASAAIRCIESTWLDQSWVMLKGDWLLAQLHHIPSLVQLLLLTLASPVSFQLIPFRQLDSMKVERNDQLSLAAGPVSSLPIGQLTINSGYLIRVT